MKIKNKIIIKICCAVLFLVFMIYPFIEPYWIEVKKDILVSQQIPASFNGKKIIFISDIHYGKFFNDNRVTVLVKQINEMRPDIIILGGDYTYGQLKDLENVFTKLKNLEAKYGVYAVLGNHDYKKMGDVARREIAKANINLMENNGFWINIGNDRIRIAGVADNDLSYPDSQLAAAEAEVKDYVVLVSHNPDYVEDANLDKIDLFLSGHNHGGQITFFGLWSPIIPSKYGSRYLTGHKIVKNVDIIISNGIGMVLLPARFFARPQINVIELKSGQ